MHLGGLGKTIRWAEGTYRRIVQRIGGWATYRRIVVDMLLSCMMFVTRKIIKKGGRDSFHRVASGDVGVTRWAWVIWVILTKLTGLGLHKMGCTLIPRTRPCPPSTAYWCYLKLAETRHDTRSGVLTRVENRRLYRGHNGPFRRRRGATCHGEDASV